VLVPASLPRTVAKSLNNRYRLYVASDGTSYAWLADARQTSSPHMTTTHELTIGWWSPGLSKPKYLRLPVKLQLPNFPLGFLTLSGHYLLVNDTLVDLNTDARTAMPSTGNRGGILPYTTPDLMAGGTEVRNGHYDAQGYWHDPASQVFNFDTSSLPDLHC
jgi:hypothetical protein